MFALPFGLNRKSEEEKVRCIRDNRGFSWLRAGLLELAGAGATACRIIGLEYHLGRRDLGGNASNLATWRDHTAVLF